MKSYLSLLFFILLNVGIQAQQAGLEAGKEQTYQGYVSGDEKAWTKGVSMLKSALDQNPADTELAYEYLVAEYGKIGYCNTTNSCGDLVPQIEDSQKRLKKLVKEEGEASRYSALMGGLLAMEIEQKPAQMMFLGPKCSSYISESVDMDTKNPTAWVEKGNLKFHAPRLFGGDMEEAIACFQKAILLYESNPSLKANSWQYLHALAWLGKAYEEEDEWGKARQTFEKALRVEPDFLWVKNELLPELLKKD